MALLPASAEHYCTLFADFLHGLGFVLKHYDCDVWMRFRKSGDGNDSICTHVGNFKVIAKDPEFLVKESGDRDY
jgi:hypothetical protein